MGRGKKVLVVDDEESVRRLLERFLVKDGHSCRCVSSAEEALLLLDREPFDLVLLDDGLPRMMGLTAIPEIQKRTSAPIVMITGLDNEEMRADAKLLGALDILLKPVDFERLTAVLRELFGADAA